MLYTTHIVYIIKSCWFLKYSIKNRCLNSIFEYNGNIYSHINPNPGHCWYIYLVGNADKQKVTYFNGKTQMRYFIWKNVSFVILVFGTYIFKYL